MKIVRPPHRRHHEYIHVFHPKVDCDKEQNCQRAGSSDCQRCTHNRNHKLDYFSPVQPYYPWYPWGPTWWYWYPSTPIYCGSSDNVAWGTAVTYTSSGTTESSSNELTPREAVEDLYLPLDEHRVIE